MDAPLDGKEALVNLVLWIVQVPLALHTLMGALWKLANPVVPTLRAIPPALWKALCVVEVVVAVALLAPACATFVPLAAGAIALEMLAFCAVHVRSGSPVMAPVKYWAVVAVVSALLGVGRFAG